MAEQLSEDLKNLDADGFYLLHNHPSGNPDPSSADIDLTQKFSQKFKGKFLGHTIIDHNKGAIIDKSGDIREYSITNEDLNDSGKSTIPSDILDEKIDSVEKLGKIAMANRPEEGRNVVILANVKLRVQVVMDVSDEMIKSDPYKLEGAIKRIGRKTGSTTAFLVTHDKSSRDAAKRHIETGIFMDVVSADGESLRAASRQNISVNPRKEKIRASQVAREIVASK
jgi:hypothetical protein